MRKLLLILLLSMSSLFAADVDTSAIHRIKVRGEKNAYTATAFFISPHRLLTAAHTFKHADRPVILIDGVEVQCHVVKINFNGDTDAALLETDYTSPTFYELSKGTVLVGYPHEFDPIKETTGELSHTIKTNNLIIDGMSGCPLFVNGIVIGMGVRSDWKSSKDSCEAISSLVLLKFIEGK